MDYKKLLYQTVNNLGNDADVIKDMQTRINKQSYTPIKEDGIWGEETQRAVNMLDDVTLKSINNRMIEDKVLKMSDEGNTDRDMYRKYLSTHTTRAPQMDLNDKLNQGVRENKREKDRFAIYVDNMKEIYDEYNRIKPIKMLDTKKHQYLSCLGGAGGLPEYVTIDLLGQGKEFLDIPDKMFNKKKRNNAGGVLGVFEDSIKDLTNNKTGRILGKVYGKNICKKIIK